MLLVDKYRPTKLDALSYHHDLSKRIQALVSVSLAVLLTWIFDA